MDPNFYRIFFLLVLLAPSKTVNVNLYLVTTTADLTTASTQGEYIDEQNKYLLFITNQKLLSYSVLAPLTINFQTSNCLSYVISLDRKKLYAFTSDGFIRCLSSVTGIEIISTDTLLTDITGMAISNNNELLLYSATTPMSVWAINSDYSITLVKNFDIYSSLTNQAFFYKTKQILMLTNKFIYLLDYSSSSVVKSTFLSLDGTNEKFVEMAVTKDFKYFGYIKILETSLTSDLSTLKIIDVQNPASFVEKLSYDQQAQVKLRFYPTSSLIMVLYLSSSSYYINYHDYLDASKTYTVTYGSRTNLASSTISAFASFPNGDGFMTATTGRGRSWKYTCSSSCSECKFPNYDECTSCPAGSSYLKLDSATCVPSCPNGYKIDNVAMTCSLCDQTCKTCMTTNTNYCLSCNQSPLPYLIESQGVCQSASCPDGTFEVTGKICRSCDTTVCATCQVSATSCLSCVDPNYFLWQELGSCHANNCPVGTTLISSHICGSCITACDVCDFNRAYCNKCQANYYLFYENSSGLFNACLSKDSLYDGIFVLDNRLDGFGVVKKCSDHCTACIGEKRCTKCSNLMAAR